MSIQFISHTIQKPEDVNVILGQAHFIKTVEDLHEALVTAVPKSPSVWPFAKHPMLAWCVGVEPIKNSLSWRGTMPRPLAPGIVCDFFVELFSH